ncbi:hypothetical protein ACFQYP_65290 [Nonomuraea antimicrobica]
MTAAAVAPACALGREELVMLAAAYSELLAASRASVAAAELGEIDPLVYLREHLAEHGQLPPAGRGRWCCWRRPPSRRRTGRGWRRWLSPSARPPRARALSTGSRPRLPRPGPGCVSCCRPAATGSTTSSWSSAS